MRERNKSRIWMGKDGSVLIKVEEIITFEIAERVINNYKEMAENLSDKPKVLIDISLAVPTTTSSFRRRITRLLKDTYKGVGFEKIAVYGGSLVASVVMGFVIVATGLENIKHFKTKEKALRWLKKA
jgi:hypothetical protein